MMQKNMEKRKIPKKNYVILAIIFAVTFLLVYYLYVWYAAYVDYQNNIGNDVFDDLISRICELNKDITNDKSLGKGFCIGHSYFCNIDNCNDDLLESIVTYEIIPMLEEYWFDDDTKLKSWTNRLMGVFSER